MPAVSGTGGMDTYTTGTVIDAIARPARVPLVWREDTAIVVLATAAALFLVAGVLRLARWRVAGDAHCALVGSALVVMGGLYLPLTGIAEVSGALNHRAAGEALMRAITTAITATLVMRSLHAKSVRPLDRPGRLLPVLATVVLSTFAGLAAVAASMPRPLAHGLTYARALSVVMVVCWIALAVTVRSRGPRRPWSRRTAPLFGLLAAAEALYGYDQGAPTGTTAALVVCTAVATAAVWSAHADLESALRQTEQTIGSLSETLRSTRARAEGLTEWRADLVHDATNSVAGLRIALDLLNDRQAIADPATATLCQAAAEEVHHLDHLLHRVPDEPKRPFDVGPVLRSLAMTARALGDDVSFHGRGATALGRPGDLVVVLKNLLSNARRHAPGALVHLDIEDVAGEVRVVCWDHGPGVPDHLAPFIFERGFLGPDSSGAGLGLHEARHLMRAQGGDLVLDQAASGARFVAILPAVTTGSRDPSRTRPVIPQQRGAARPFELSGGRRALHGDRSAED